MGPPGSKGSTGIKGSRGIRGFTGIQGPKGVCVVSPKIFVFPESQYVIVNKPATFYCWVQGHLSSEVKDVLAPIIKKKIKKCNITLRKCNEQMSQNIYLVSSAHCHVLYTILAFKPVDGLVYDW